MTSAIEIQHTAGTIIIVTSEWNKKSRIHTSGAPNQTIVKCVSDKPVSFLTSKLTKKHLSLVTKWCTHDWARFSINIKSKKNSSKQHSRSRLIGTDICVWKNEFFDLSVILVQHTMHLVKQVYSAEDPLVDLKEICCVKSFKNQRQYSRSSGLEAGFHDGIFVKFEAEKRPWGEAVFPVTQVCLSVTAIDFTSCICKNNCRTTEKYRPHLLKFMH